MMARQPCGTYGGAQQHRRRGETLCQPCRQARNGYAARRRTDPYARQRERRLHAERQRALSRLAREYPGRYRELLAEERDQRRWSTAPPPAAAPRPPARLAGGVTPAESIAAEIERAS